MKQVEECIAGIEERLTEKQPADEQISRMLIELHKNNFDFAAVDISRRKSVLFELTKSFKPSEFIEDRTRLSLVINKKKKFDCSEHKRELINKIFREVTFPKLRELDSHSQSGQQLDHPHLGKRALNDLQPLSNP